MKYLLLVAQLMISLVAQAELCDGLFVAKNQDMQNSTSARQKLARKLIRNGFSGQAYVARWRAKNKAAQGPFTEQGETLVMGVEKENYDKWMKAIGQSSIGIGIYGLPEDGHGTAYLRIGDKFFNHHAAAEGRKPKSFKGVFNSGEAWYHTVGLTEATISMSKSEMKDILRFFEARGRGQITAQEPIRGYELGERIRPFFDEQGKTLLNESCAGACTSFLMDGWLDNMNDQSLAKRLRKIRDRYNLNFNYVARANVWQNFRNPAASISILRIDTSAKYFSKDFISENSWGNIRGLYKYAFLPDGGVKHEVQSYKSYRLSLADYLEDPDE